MGTKLKLNWETNYPKYLEVTDGLKQIYCLSATLFKIHQILISQDYDDIEYISREMIKEFHELVAGSCYRQNRIYVYWWNETRSDFE